MKRSKLAIARTELAKSLNKPFIYEIIFPENWCQSQVLIYLLNKEYIQGDLSLRHSASNAGLKTDWFWKTDLFKLIWVFKKS